MRTMVVFDDGLGQLAPLTDLRAAFDIRTGVTTTLERLCAVGDLAGLFVPDHLADLCRERHQTPVNDENCLRARADHVLLVNGRLVLTDLLRSLKPDTILVEHDSGHLIAGLLRPDLVIPAIRAEPRGITTLRTSPGDRHLLGRPWHIRTFRDRAIAADLAFATQPAGGAAGDPRAGWLTWPGPRAQPPGVALFGDHPVTAAPTARIYPGAILDTELGPILLDDHAVIRPGAIISGPAAIGLHSTVLERATIKPFTSIGPWCKVNGEVGGTIFQGFANKAHDGHLGDSYIGEWSNLGAGTTNSNLLNTYSEVVARATPSGPNERTGEIFLGALVGDHVKFAICTRIMTGAVINTGVMYAATAPASGCIPAFSWMTDSGSRRFRLDKFTDTARAVMARRKVTPSLAYLQRMTDLHAATQD